MTTPTDPSAYQAPDRAIHSPAWVMQTYLTFGVALLAMAKLERFLNEHDPPASDAVSSRQNEQRPRRCGAVFSALGGTRTPNLLIRSQLLGVRKGAGGIEIWPCHQGSSGPCGPPVQSMATSLSTSRIVCDHGVTTPSTEHSEFQIEIPYLHRECPDFDKGDL